MFDTLFMYSWEFLWWGRWIRMFPFTFAFCLGEKGIHLVLSNLIDNWDMRSWCHYCFWTVAISCLLVILWLHSREREQVQASVSVWHSDCPLSQLWHSFTRRRGALGEELLVKQTRSFLPFFWSKPMSSLTLISFDSSGLKGLQWCGTLKL